MKIDEREFTAERFHPGTSDSLSLEHEHRYQMARLLAKDKAILDLASGEGHGSALLASVARSVIAVDLSEAAVNHAKKSYKRENLEFRVGSCTNLPIPDRSVDLVVAFETIEHLDSHDQMFAEIKRVLRREGCLIISTPEKAAFTDATGLINPFHVKELYREEFVGLMSRYFRHVIMHDQRIGFGSLIASKADPAPTFEIDSSTGVTQKGLIQPLYLIAVASDEPGRAEGLTSLFSQSIQASEPVLKRVEFERAQLDEEHRKELERAKAVWEERLQTELEREQQASERRHRIELKLQQEELGERRRTELEQQQKVLAEQHRTELERLSAGWEDWHWRELAIERAGWDEQRKEIERLSEAVATLQHANWHVRVSFQRFFRRLIWSRVLYRISGFGLLGERHRNRFARSAVKRDPLLLSQRVEQFNAQFFNTVVRQAAEPLIAPAPQANKLSPGLTVSAIVPNFNHARFLRKRLESILRQSYPVIEIVVLDDASTDDSKLVIEQYRNLYPQRIRTIYNEIRSGNVFDQWKKGHEAAKGDLVWICESDDSCESDFLEKLIPLFSDSSVMFAFGRIQFMDEAGRMRPGLDQYRDSTEAGIWNKRVIRPAREWFSGAFGVKNVIANVGGSLWRRFAIASEVWDAAKTYKIMGDWYLYSALARGGQIAYEPAAISYFRIHQSNTSVEAQKHASYYQEYARLMAAVRDRWDIPDATVHRFVDSCREVFRAASPDGCSFENILRPHELLSIRPSQIHVLMGFLGFSYGGGELFPINLANALHRRGIMVSMLHLWDKMDHPAVRLMLDPGIPVYTAQMLREMGIRNFINSAGISIVHSNIATVEMVMLDEGDASIPYLATLHGSYEAMEIPLSSVENWWKKISLFVYTAERNLEPFRNLETPASRFRKLRNAMPVDERPFPGSRAKMGIPDDALVFAFVARGVEGKGWREAVHAFTELERRRPEQEMVLLMVGDGEETEKARLTADGNPRIRFLGFQQEIHGLYRMSDVALAPTRFSGESYPLCLIQAMQVGTPVIATDVGDIKAMLELDGKRAGILIPYITDDDVFVSEIADAMEASLDPESRRHFAGVARSIGEAFDIEALCDTYLQLYATAIQRHAAGDHGQDQSVT